MKKNVALVFGLALWFAVLGQFFLAIDHREVSIPETIFRFFSFFSILTNILAAIYFTFRAFNSKALKGPGTLTSIAVYCTIVSLVYQFLLRYLWHPMGLQVIVNELLFTVNPLLVFIYWYLYENKRKISYFQIPRWLLYPLIYLFFILIRGSYSGFYPYPLVNEPEIGLFKVFINSAIVLFFFVIVAWSFVALGHRLTRGKIVV